MLVHCVCLEDAPPHHQSSDFIHEVLGRIEIRRGDLIRMLNQVVR